MKDEYNQERLGKIVKLAKNGIGGEKANAIKLLKTLCDKYGLKFEEVMEQGELESEHIIHYKKEIHTRLVAQIVYKYSGCDTIEVNRYRRTVRIKSTQEKYIETLNAVDVLVRLYDKERKKFKDAVFYGFLDKHRLYSDRKEGDEEKEFTDDEIAVRRAGYRMAGQMEDAELLKRLN